MSRVVSFVDWISIHNQCFDFPAEHLERVYTFSILNLKACALQRSAVRQIGHLCINRAVPIRDQVCVGQHLHFRHHLWRRPLFHAGGRRQPCHPPYLFRVSISFSLSMAIHVDAVSSLVHLLTRNLTICWSLQYDHNCCVDICIMTAWMQLDVM